MFVVFLILGSILSVDRDLLMKSFWAISPRFWARLPERLSWVRGSRLFWENRRLTPGVLSIALPIMGGGNGAGALPMSKVYGGGHRKGPVRLVRRLLCHIDAGKYCCGAVCGHFE